MYSALETVVSFGAWDVFWIIVGCIPFVWEVFATFGKK